MQECVPQCVHEINFFPGVQIMLNQNDSLLEIHLKQFHKSLEQTTIYSI